MRRPITYYGNPLLRVRSTPIEEITDDIRLLAQDMIDMLDEIDAIGLAAVQVGVPIRLFVCRSYVMIPNEPWTMTPAKVYINPKLSNHSEELVEDQEGCISIPKLRGNVIRPLKLTIEALDLDGKLFTEDLEGYNARSRMHENDHLNGVLYIDRMHENDRKKLDADLRAIKKAYK